MNAEIVSDDISHWKYCHGEKSVRREGAQTLAQTAQGNVVR